MIYEDCAHDKEESQRTEFGRNPCTTGNHLRTASTIYQRGVNKRRIGRIPGKFFWFPVQIKIGIQNLKSLVLQNIRERILSAKIQNGLVFPDAAVQEVKCQAVPALVWIERDERHQASGICVASSCFGFH